MRGRKTTVWLNRKQTAEYIMVSLRQLDRWRRIGYFPKGSYVGSRPVWSTDELDEWIRGHPNSSYYTLKYLTVTRAEKTIKHSENK